MEGEGEVVVTREDIKAVARMIGTHIRVSPNGAVIRDSCQEAVIKVIMSREEEEEGEGAEAAADTMIERCHRHPRLR